ncbi:flagellar hook-basal body complex protein [Sporosarcina psychrophila]|uniref:Flagellar hook protein FlgE n=2 Tax=Sporosarcina psychrophila TaxID=1476 RepID=A0ABV2K7X8_SPOPS
MLRSMYSGISGLRNFQTKLDVIGNNIANVNTYGFKKGRTIFKDLISQTVAGASAPGDARGGVNPKQVGLGSQIAAIDTLHTGGSTQFTGNTLDLAVAGDGFFQVMQGNETMYTRAGNFYMDSSGDIVDGDGRYVQGESGKITIPTTASSMSVGQDGTVYFVDLPQGGAAKIAAAEVALKGPAKTFEPFETALKDAEIVLKTNKADFKAAEVAWKKAAAGDQSIPAVKDATDAALLVKDAEAAKITAAEVKVVEAQLAYDGAKPAYDKAKNDFDKVMSDNKATLQEAGQIQMAKFSNPGGLEKTGGNLFRETANSGEVLTGVALQQGFGKVESGFLEMSNVDLAEEFTEMIVAQRGFQANTRIITTSDEILQELVNLKR